MENKTLHFDVDVAVVGAGLVGLAAAVAMHQQGYRVALVDRQNPEKIFAQTPNVWDARIYAISEKNKAWLTNLGVWQHLNVSRIATMQGMEIWADASDAPLELSAEDMHAQGLGEVIEAGALSKVLLEKVQALGITTFFEVVPEKLMVSPHQATLTLKSSQDTQLTLSTDLLLAADGSQSWVREQCGFFVKRNDYDHHGLVANFNAENNHQHIARQWFISGEDGHVQVLAWLPLPDNLISIVWSASASLTESLLQLSPDALAEKVAEAGNHALGKLVLATPPVAFPLALQKVEPVFLQSVVLLGDAAHQVHPMAGQGVNLGFRDVEDLIETLKNKRPYQSINDTQLLKKYARARKVDVAKMVFLTDGLYQLFDSSSELIKKVRNLGFEATKHRLLKSILLKQAAKL
jgi:ubiquinone biosynthesis UbiH/UbiF/VisC/COQ6 family hydroxylase